MRNEKKLLIWFLIIGACVLVVNYKEEILKYKPTITMNTYEFEDKKLDCSSTMRLVVYDNNTGKNLNPETSVYIVGESPKGVD